MADQVYNLTQTGAEVQGIINDANNVKGAGATTSLTTDYIMLKDTNGQYHKIQKDSFTEAVRNTLASLLVNNDKGTTISQIAAIASGDFGSVTPANLASVLGGILKTQILMDKELLASNASKTIIIGNGEHVGLYHVYVESHGYSTLFVMVYSRIQVLDTYGSESFCTIAGTDDQPSKVTITNTSNESLRFTLKRL